MAQSPLRQLRLRNFASTALDTVFGSRGEIYYDQTTNTLRIFDGDTQGGVGISGQITAATIVETSSIVFKENITPIENALDTVMKLFGVFYDRKDTKEHEAGLIAEDVYKHAPDLVSLDKDGKPYGIKYTKLGAYLVESIKELKQEINSLKAIK